MQFNLVNNEQMLVVLFIWVHVGAVCLAIRGLIPMCTCSSRSCSLRVVAIWNHAGKSIVQPLLFLKRLFSALVLFSFFCFPPTTPPFFVFPLLSQCDECLDVPLWGLMAGLQGLLAMREFYCLGAGWRPLDNLGTHLPLSSTSKQL